MTIINQVAYLRTTREFPSDSTKLLMEIDRSYVDVANAVNVRTIGLFPINRPAITGEGWFINSSRQQTLRQIYTFGALNAGMELDITTGITSFTQFTRIYGTCITVNGTGGMPDWRPLPYVDSALITNSVTLLVGTFIAAGERINRIRIINGATAPNITSGIVVLEWMVNI